MEQSDDESAKLTEDKNAGKPTEPIVSGNMLKRLLKIPRGTTLRDQIADLKSRPSAREVCTKAMQYPIDIVEGRFCDLMLDDYGRRLRLWQLYC